MTAVDREIDWLRRLVREIRSKASASAGVQIGIKTADNLEETAGVFEQAKQKINELERERDALKKQLAAVTKQPDPPRSAGLVLEID